MREWIIKQGVEDPTIPGYMVESLRAFYHENLLIAQEVLHKEILDLTQRERFAICYVMGVPIRISTDDSRNDQGLCKIDYKLARNVGFSKVDGKIHVHVMPEG